tara:strand:- start:931 stop:1167 length:237 start_codon:yes stop_codon:yes gene_type:complete
MPTALEAISHQALVLPPDQRMELARTLIESVEGSDYESPEEAWNDEILQRLQRYREGETQGIPAADVFRKLREIAPRV